MTYAQEGADSDLFTNKAMNACRIDEVPVGVPIQTDDENNSALVPNQIEKQLANAIYIIY